jgi:hypothetical protein
VEAPNREGLIVGNENVGIEKVKKAFQREVKTF